MIIVYGIQNCDSVRRARAWLDERGLVYRFFDFRALELEASRIRHWCDLLGWECVLNRRSRAWRQLGEHERKALNADTVVAWLRREPLLIKRPVVEWGDGNVSVGFSDQAFLQRLQASRA